MSNPKSSRAGLLAVSRPYNFVDEDISYNFGFDKHLWVIVLISKKEIRDNKEINTNDVIRVPWATIHNSWLFAQQHSWLSENFRVHLLKYLKLPAFF